MGKTAENLKEAFAGESQANRRYIAFAQKADKEGLPQVAKLFRAAAEAETVHALNHLRAMNGVAGTLENLKAASSGEAAEFKQMYPAFIEQAKKDGDKAAQRTFDYANQVEQIHHQMYNKAIGAVEGGGDLPRAELYVCQGCGNTVEGEPPDRCPICGAPKKMFKRID